MIHYLIVRPVYLARTAATQRPQDYVAFGGNDVTRRKPPRILSPGCIKWVSAGISPRERLATGKKSLPWAAPSLDVPMMVVGTRLFQQGFQFLSKRRIARAGVIKERANLAVGKFARSQK